MVYTGVVEGERIKPKKALLRRLRSWGITLGLGLSDATAFATSYVLFRAGTPVPAIVLYHGKALLPHGIDIFTIIATFFILFRYLAGDYGRRQLFWDGARLTTRSLLLASIPDLVLFLLVGGKYPIGGIVASWLFLLVAVPLFRQGARLIMAQLGVWNLSTVLIGTTKNAEDAFVALSQSLSLGFSVQHLVANDRSEIPESLLGLAQIPFLSGPDLVRRILGAGSRQVVFASDDAPSPQLTEAMQYLIGAGVGVALIPSLRGLPLFGLSTNYFFGEEILLIQVRNNLSRLTHRAIKRLVDFIGSAVLLVVLSPVFIAFALAILLDDGKGPFFKQKRVGRDGKDFECFKFRTMTLDAEAMLHQWQQDDSALFAEYRAANFKLRDDPRVTRVGRWLRKTSLDELPQLLNVLLGEMSLVGPRPLLRREIPDYGPSIDLYQMSRPGITGLWQIRGRSETAFADRVAFDAWYIRNWSLWYDAVILLQTVSVLLRRQGAY